MTQPMTDFRALCAELADDIEEWMVGTDHSPPSSVELVHRVRAALAEPEGPTDEELWEAYDQMDGVPEDWAWVRDYARAILARWGNTVAVATNPMTEQHPITQPPWELVKKWMTEIWHEGTPVQISASDVHIATRAAQWGADQQLEEDAKWLDHNALNEAYLRITPVGEALKEAMRPKPPSLKQQALSDLKNAYNADMICDTTFENIRRALEALDD